LKSTLRESTRAKAAAKDEKNQNLTASNQTWRILKITAHSLLKKYSQATTASPSNAIFTPRELQNIFCEIREIVALKFPERDRTQFTAISGFLFLRFFAPAILNPPLFGINLGNLQFIQAL
jgi:hypothetical protein